jgi:broad specificity phosphatase PhoE
MNILRRFFPPPPPPIPSIPSIPRNPFYTPPSNVGLLSHNQNRNNHSQRVIVVRHGERVDSIFGRDWMNNQEYRHHRNMPDIIISRAEKMHHQFDPPLTKDGLEKAKLVGEEMAKKGIIVDFIYSSPALRSIQTADKILEGMGLKYQIPIRIEPGLFELLSWQDFIPYPEPFLDIKTLRSYGYNIQINYNPVMKFHQLLAHENEIDYYQRSHHVTKRISDSHPNNGKFLFLFEFDSNYLSILIRFNSIENIQI